MALVHKPYMRLRSFWFVIVPFRVASGSFACGVSKSDGNTSVVVFTVMQKIVTCSWQQNSRGEVGPLGHILHFSDYLELFIDSTKI